MFRRDENLRCNWCSHWYALKDGFNALFCSEEHAKKAGR
jgi:hypothetical protein